MVALIAKHKLLTVTVYNGYTICCKFRIRNIGQADLPISIINIEQKYRTNLSDGEM